MAAGRAGDALEVHGHLAGIVTVAGCQNYRGSVAGSVRVEGNGGFARVGAAAGRAGIGAIKGVVDGCSRGAHRQGETRTFRTAHQPR